ncbi:MAG TPA: hypothetical protein VLX61_10065 [Anaerolineales bacterium]|nr:hypothetical protein [Anaerolineales bacterium]
MDLGLKEKRAFVTASSRGLGYATVVALLAAEGCRVVINGRDETNVKTSARKYGVKRARPPSMRRETRAIHLYLRN